MDHWLSSVLCHAALPHYSLHPFGTVRWQLKEDSEKVLGIRFDLIFGASILPFLESSVWSLFLVLFMFVLFLWILWIILICAPIECPMPVSVMAVIWGSLNSLNSSGLNVDPKQSRFKNRLSHGCHGCHVISVMDVHGNRKVQMPHQWLQNVLNTRSTRCGSMPSAELFQSWHVSAQVWHRLLGSYSREQPLKILSMCPYKSKLFYHGTLIVAEAKKKMARPSCNICDTLTCKAVDIGNKTDTFRQLIACESWKQNSLE